MKHFTAEFAESSIKLTLLFGNDATFSIAKSRCEAIGQRLAVLDTEEKRNSLHEQRM